MLSLEDEERAALVETSDRGDSGERFDAALPVPWYWMRNAEAQYNADRSSICMERDFMPLALKDLGNCVEVKRTGVFLCKDQYRKLQAKWQALIR